MSKNNTLATKINAALKERATPLWEGPYQDSSNGGITYSLLSKFLCCRHRFWLRAIKGLKADEGFNYKMEYGNAWHYCEENLAAGFKVERILILLKEYCIKLATEHSQESVEINKLYNCIKAQFPHYVEYWSKNDDVKKRKPVWQEQVFICSYTLPSGRVVILRGKMDSVDLIDKGYWVQENKSKSDIKQEDLKSDLLCDLQSMIYIICLQELQREGDKDLGKTIPVKGVRYNVIRRPLSGMKFNIKQKKGLGKAKKGAENEEQFYTRLSQLIKDNAKSFFVRMKVEVTEKDIAFFKKCVLNPILEQLCDWWDSIEGDPFNPWFTDDDSSTVSPDLVERIPNKHHYLYPSGIYNSILEGRKHPFDKLIYSGDERGFQRSSSLFPELLPVEENQEE